MGLPSTDDAREEISWAAGRWKGDSCVTMMDNCTQGVEGGEEGAGWMGWADGADGLN